MGKRIQPGIRHLLYGLWAGWTGVLLLARSELFRFTVQVPPDGILGYCFVNGYPKQQDYFWFVAMVVGGLAGTMVTLIGLRYLEKQVRVMNGGKFFLWAGMAGSLGSLLLALSPGFTRVPAIWIIYLCGIVCPWLWRGWLIAGKETGPDLPPRRNFPVLGYWPVIIFALALVWVADARLRCRMIDGIHEGTQLLYVQSLLAGQKLGIDFRTEYGPLGTLGLYGWMKATGMTIAQERLYYILMQAGGVAIHLIVFRIAGLGWLATGVGSLLVLTESSALGVQYGGATALRTAGAFLAVVLYWRARFGGIKWLTASGIFQSIALMYSPDFGLASGLAIVAMYVRDRIFREKTGSLLQLVKWIGVASAGLVFLSFFVYGMSAPAGLSGLFFGGYGGSRLLGHGARPFPVFELGGDWKALREVWLMGFISVGMLAWSLVSNASANRRTLLAGSGMFTLLAMIPGLARPMGQFLFAVPSCAFMVAVGLDSGMTLAGIKKKVAIYLACFIVVIACLDVFSIFQPLMEKYTPCGWNPDGQENMQGTERLGRVLPLSMVPEDVVLGARTIAALSKKGDLVYVGAPAHAHLCFLADRPGLPPYPSGAIAATDRQRAEVLEALKKTPPAVALLSQSGIDIPYAIEHREEVDYIKRNYTLALKTGDLEIYRLSRK